VTCVPPSQCNTPVSSECELTDGRKEEGREEAGTEGMKGRKEGRSLSKQAAVASCALPKTGPHAHVRTRGSQVWMMVMGVNHAAKDSRVCAIGTTMPLSKTAAYSSVRLVDFLPEITVTDVASTRFYCHTKCVARERVQAVFFRAECMGEQGPGGVRAAHRAHVVASACCILAVLSNTYIRARGPVVSALCVSARPRAARGTLHRRPCSLQCPHARRPLDDQQQLPAASRYRRCVRACVPWCAHECDVCRATSASLTAATHGALDSLREPAHRRCNVLAGIVRDGMCIVSRRM
jgi:hypothetical protein